MRIKKVILIVMTLFLVTGCNIEYNLNIDENNNFIENFNIYAYADNNYSLEEIYDSYLEEYPIYIDQEFMYYDPYNKNSDFTYYEKSFKKLSNGYEFSYNSKYSFNDFKRARTLKETFNNVSLGFVNDKNYYYISLNSPILFEANENLESIKINLSFDDYEVISHNADKVLNGVYTWNLTKNHEGRIEVKYKRKETFNKVDDEGKKDSIVNYIFLGSVLILFVVAIIGLIKYKSVNRNV